jgi:hypothetical protein
MKLGNTVYSTALLGCLSALFCAISAFVAILPPMLAAAFANMERHVGLCLEAEGNKIQHLL